MTLDEYEYGGKELYADFARAVQFILRAALAADKKITHQTIQMRAKSLKEVRKKLKGSVTDIEKKVKDLAGVRVIVYTNSDRDRLRNSDLLHQNFVIDWDRTKFHYPSENGEDTQSQFIGYNYVIKLNDTRATLAEYERYAGLFCELQIQTILDHAWSEPAHNTIYKRPDLEGVGQAWMTEVEKRLNAIQQKYLIPAGYEFQKVMTDFELIKSGKSLIEEEILISIQKADDNNVLVELLEQYTTLVLPLFKDTVIPAAEIRAALVAAVRKAVRTAASVIETPFGTIPGASDVEVLEKIIRILESIQYVDPDKAYATYSELYISFDESEPKQKVITAVGKLAQNNLYVWQHYGPTVQEMLLNAIKTTPQDRRDNTRSLMIEVAKNCLESEMTDFSSTSKSVTWTTASITISDRLLGVRDTAMAMLQDLFDTSRRDDETEIIYSAMRSATRLPTQIKNSNSLIQRAFADSQRIINFITERSRDLPNLFKEKLEHDMLFEYRRAKGLPANLLEDEGVRAAADGVVAAALSLRERFNADGDYVIFKTLVGFESVFDYEWDEDDGEV